MGNHAMTDEELSIVARRQVSIDQMEFAGTMFSLTAAVELLREQVHRRNGLNLAMSSLEGISAIRDDLNDLINEITGSFDCQRAAE